MTGARISVKICGINTKAALDHATDAGADWVGFVFFPPSPRAVTPTEAAGIAAHRPDGPRRVGLFVTPGDAEIEAALDAIPLDILQIHDTPERAAAIRARFARPVWRAAGIATATDLPHDAPGIDALLLDAKAPPGAPLPGGNAHPFDWSVLRAWSPPGPWLLAGGLTPGNVAEAIRVSGATAVDVSSGVERVRGLKDASLIRAFVEAAREFRSSRAS